MSDYEVLLKKAEEFHGHICGGIVLGTRLTIAGMRELGMTPGEHNHNLIVYTEIDRCGADAVQALTGCSLGHRNLKHKDFGKFAALFVDISTGKAVRVSVHEKNRAKNEQMDPKDMLKILGELPESDILKIEIVEIKVPEDDIPGFPHNKAICSMCGEHIMDNRHVCIEGKVLCKNCANGSYYKVLETKA